MTKILTRKCSVPDRSGDIKLNMCDFNILYACQMDIECYNYIDDMFHQYRSGKLLAQTKDKKKADDSDPAHPPGFNAGVVFLPMTA